MKNNFTFDPSPDSMTAEELAKMQTYFLRKHLRFCIENSPFYKKHLKGVDPAKVTLENLHELPLTSKLDLASTPSKFIAVPKEMISDISFSSGTTGRPCRIAYSRSDMRRLALNEHRSLAASGITEKDTVLLTCTIDRCFIAGAAYYLGVESIGAAAVRNGLNTIESHADVISELHPSAIIGVPSFLRRLGSYLNEHSIPVSSVKKIICIGEPLRDRDLSLNACGESLRKIWGAKVYSTYSSSELVTSFCECEAGCGGHLIPELAVAEIIDEKGNVLPPGAVGELVVTPMRVTGMPLVRFRTGDITFMATGRCACGRFAPRIGPILGRRAQMLKVHGTTLYPQSIYSALDTMPDRIIEYYIEVGGSGLSDEVTAVAAVAPGADVKEIENILRSKCRVRIPLRTEDEDAVKRRIFSVSRKPVRFFDKRTKPE